MESKFLKAKELFEYYGGSKYQMMRDNVIDKYLSYNIPEFIEFIWINELFFKICSQLNEKCDNFIYLSTLIDINIEKLLKNIYILEEAIRYLHDNSLCKREIKILLDSIIDNLNKINQNIFVEEEKRRFEKLRGSLSV